MLHNILTELLGIEYPIIQAPMAGGITTSALVSEVSNAGGLGMVGAGYMPPAQIREQIKEIRQLTNKPFGINLFVPADFEIAEDKVKAANQVLQPFREKLGIHDTNTKITEPIAAEETYKEQIKVVIEEKVPVCSFAFGIPSSEVIQELKRQGVILMGTATTVEEAVEIEKSGMDVVVVQGSEAGGHRGTFLKGSKESLIGLMSLIPQAADSVRIPVVAAGGIMDGRGLMASLCLGAKAVQMGTAFLTCAESGAHEQYKAAILRASEDQTVLTSAFSGKLARGIENDFTREMKKHEASLPDFPVQNALTQPVRKASAQMNDPEYMSLWSGQSPRLAKSRTADELIKSIIARAREISRNV